MPAPGDQHKTVTNPFQDQPTRISEYSAKEIATLQSRLEKQLGPEYLSARSGPSGQKVHYIAAEKVITLANEVFGFNGWSSSIQNIQIDFVDEHPQTLRISIGLSVIVRVTLRDGTYHEDIGYGHIENCKGKAAAFEKAKKEGTTDGLKRALRSFGNVLGNCIYDKAYVDKVSKMKVAPVRRFDESGLHRHADYAVKTEPVKPVKPVAAVAPVAAPAKTILNDASFPMDGFDEEDLLGDFDEADFCVTEEGHPDEVVVPEVPSLPPPQHNNASRNTSRNTSPVRQVPPQQNSSGDGPSRPAVNGMPPRAPQTPNAMHSRPALGAHGANGANGANSARPYQPANNANRPGLGPRPNLTNNNNHMNHNANPNGNTNKPNAAPSSQEGTPWLSARAVAKVGDGDALGAVSPAVQPAHLFNPKAESPSIRKTPGFDHNTSKPIPRMGRPGGPAGAAVGGTTVAQTSNTSNTSHMTHTTHMHSTHTPNSVNANSTNTHVADTSRRIGAPPSMASPLANRNQFRPPPMKRPPPTDGNRAPLADVSANVSTHGGTTDVKRQKLA